MKTVIVLTQPRSGSSLLTGMLHKLGINMCPESDIKKGAHLNELGCYENQEILSFITSSLIECGGLGTWNVRIDEGELEKFKEEEREKLRRIIEKYEEDLWGFKLSAYGYFEDLFHECLTNPYYVYLKRDEKRITKSKLESVQSQSRVNFVKHALSFLPFKTLVIAGFNWIKHLIKGKNLVGKEGLTRRVTRETYERLDDFVEGKKHIVVNFSDLINEPNSALKEVIKFLNIDVGEEDFEEALSFVHPECVNH